MFAVREAVRTASAEVRRPAPAQQSVRAQEALGENQQTEGEGGAGGGDLSVVPQAVELLPQTVGEPH